MTERTTDHRTTTPATSNTTPHVPGAGDESRVGDENRDSAGAGVVREQPEDRTLIPDQPARPHGSWKLVDSAEAAMWDAVTGDLIDGSYPARLARQRVTAAITDRRRAVGKTRDGRPQLSKKDARAAQAAITPATAAADAADGAGDRTLSHRLDSAGLSSAYGLTRTDAYALALADTVPYPSTARLVAAGDADSGWEPASDSQLAPIGTFALAAVLAVCEVPLIAGSTLTDPNDLAVIMTLGLMVLVCLGIGGVTAVESRRVRDTAELGPALPGRTRKDGTAAHQFTAGIQPDLAHLMHRCLDVATDKDDVVWGFYEEITSLADEAAGCTDERRVHFAAALTGLSANLDDLLDDRQQQAEALDAPAGAGDAGAGGAGGDTDSAAAAIEGVTAADVEDLGARLGAVVDAERQAARSIRGTR